MPPRARHPANPLARRAEEVVALGCVFLALGADLALLRVGLDAEDEGYFVEQATRVLSDQLPYRDFDSLYTPALLYLHAATIWLFGGSPIIDLRVVGFTARVILALALYMACRPMLRPALAVLPSLYVLIALDRIPITWEPHPGWPSAALTVVAIAAALRLPRTRGVRRNALLIAIGAVAALVFALKQNAGVLLGLALVASTTWNDIDGRGLQVTRPLRIVQFVVLVGVGGAAAWLVYPHASLDVLVYFLVPLVAAAVACLAPVRVSASGRGSAAWFNGLGWMGLGWILVSIPWLVVLLSALDWNLGLIKSFVGVVNQDILWYPLTGPDNGSWASLLAMAVALLAMVCFRGRPLLLLTAAGSLCVFAGLMVLLTSDTTDSLAVAIAAAPARASVGMSMILPVASIVGGAWFSLRTSSHRTAWWLRWMTLSSAVTFLTEYPRIDEVHLAWSACLPLATGTLVLVRVYAELTRRWRATSIGRIMVAAALLLVPAATSLRALGIRAQDFLDLSRSE